MVVEGNLYSDLQQRKKVKRRHAQRIFDETVRFFTKKLQRKE